MELVRGGGRRGMRTAVRYPNSSRLVRTRPRCSPAEHSHELTTIERGSPRQTATQGHEADEGARLQAALLLRLVEGHGERRRGGVPVPLDIVVHLVVRKAEALLLTTIGRKSGQPRTTPLLYLKDGDNVLLAASKGGMPHHPLWYLNLQANPKVEVEIGSKKIPMVARQASAEEKGRLWPRLVALYPAYAAYQTRTDRDIPVLILTPR